MSHNSITKTTATRSPSPPPMTLKHDGRWVAGSPTPQPRTCGFRLPTRRSKLRPGKFLKRLGTKLARATRLVSTGKERSSCKVSSSSATLVRSRSCADPITDNSHRAQAIEDCIEFLNSSALRRHHFVSSYSA